MCVPPRKYPSWTSTRPSVSKFAIRDWPWVWRWEAEEELRAVRDQVGSLDACRCRHRLGQARSAREAAALEPLPDARQLEQAVRRREEALRAVGDMFAMVAAQQKGDVVLLEDRRLRVAREPRGVEQR